MYMHVANIYKSKIFVNMIKKQRIFNPLNHMHDLQSSEYRVLVF